MPAAPPLCRAPLCRGAAAAPLACKLPTCACPLAAQRRGMFIQTQPTPNPASLMFIPGQKVLEGGSKSFTSAREAMASPLAKKLFAIDGVTQVGRPACEYVPCVCVCGQARGPTPMHPTICAGAHRPLHTPLPPHTTPAPQPAGLLRLRLCDRDQERGLWVGSAKARRVCRHHGPLLVWGGPLLRRAGVCVCGVCGVCVRAGKPWWQLAPPTRAAPSACPALPSPGASFCAVRRTRALPST